MEYAYASFWARCMALIIDCGIFGVASFILGFVIGFLYTTLSQGSDGIHILGQIINIIFLWIYAAGTQSSRWQGTPGMRIMGIRVADRNGRRITIVQATIRLVFFCISIMTLGLGFLLMLVTRRRQALQDLVARTIVIQKNP